MRGRFGTTAGARGGPSPVNRPPPPKAITTARTSPPERRPNANSCRAIPTGWTRTATGWPARSYRSVHGFVHTRSNTRESAAPKEGVAAE